jgi:hypothetical protein
VFHVSLVHAGVLCHVLCERRTPELGYTKQACQSLIRAIKQHDPEPLKRKQKLHAFAAAPVRKHAWRSLVKLPASVLRGNQQISHNKCRCGSFNGTVKEHKCANKQAWTWQIDLQRLKLSHFCVDHMSKHCMYFRQSPSLCCQSSYLYSPHLYLANSMVF